MACWWHYLKQESDVLFVTLFCRRVGIRELLLRSLFHQLQRYVLCSPFAMQLNTAFLLTRVKVFCESSFLRESVNNCPFYVGSNPIECVDSFAHLLNLFLTSLMTADILQR